MNNPRVIFAGTPEFALASLRALLESGIVPVAVLTQPDRPAGRGKRLKASPVKDYALEHDIDVLQPESLRDDDIVAQLTALQADIMVVAAYGLLLPQRVLDIPKSGCLNVHASLLPRWRGAAPIQAAILAADEETGVCLMSMTAGLDCGPVFVSETLEIGAAENAGELHDRLAAAGGTLLVEYLADIIDSRISAAEQNDAAERMRTRSRPLMQVSTGNDRPQNSHAWCGPLILCPARISCSMTIVLSVGAQKRPLQMIRAQGPLLKRGPKVLWLSAHKVRCD